MKRILELAILGAVGGALAYAAFITFLLPGGWQAYLEKRRDFAQLYVYNVDEHFIDIDFRLPSGGTTRLSQHAHHAALLNFFTSGCLPCNGETAPLERLSEKYQSRGLLVVGIDVNESSASAEAYKRQHGLTYAVWLLENNVEGGFDVPFSLVIDGQGVVRYAGDGRRAGTLDDAVAKVIQ